MIKNVYLLIPNQYNFFQSKKKLGLAYRFLIHRLIESCIVASLFFPPGLAWFSGSLHHQRILIGSHLHFPWPHDWQVTHKKLTYHGNGNIIQQLDKCCMDFQEVGQYGTYFLDKLDFYPIALMSIIGCYM